MYKIIGADQREYGPVNTDQVRQWIRAHRANAETLAQAEGDTQWKPLATFPEFATDVGALPPEVTPMVALPFAADPMTYAQDILGQDYALDIGRCLRRGWELARDNFGLLVKANLLVWLIFLGCSAVPVAGIIANVLIAGPLYGGLYWLYLKLLRGQSGQVSDVFEGFQRAFSHLMVAQVMIGLLTLVSAFLFILAVLLMFVFRNQVALAMASLMAIVGLLPAIYLWIGWIFTLPLIMDHQLGFWDAMEVSRRKVDQHWWSVFGLVFTATVLVALFWFWVTIASVIWFHQMSWLMLSTMFLVCIVGIIFTFLVFMGALMSAYEEIFNRPINPTV